MYLVAKLNQVRGRTLIKFGFLSAIFLSFGVYVMGAQNAFSLSPTQQVFVVNTNTLGNEACTQSSCGLDAAILAANASPNGALPDQIHFDLDPSETFIEPQVRLPNITESVIIDGTTQSGSQCHNGTSMNLGVTLDGTNAGRGVSGLTIEADGSEVRGMTIQNYRWNGIYLLDAGDTVIECNEILNNGNIGIYLLTGGGSRVGGPLDAQRNVVIGSGLAGIDISSSSENVIQGNYIGVAADGTTPAANINGIYILLGGNNLIGGDTPAAGNIVAGNDSYGILFDQTLDNTAQNNLVGIDAALNPKENELGGIYLFNSSNHTVGGDGVGNRVAYNGGPGVAVANVSTSATSNLIQQNEIHDNVGIGIDLGDDGATPNDLDDLDEGPNRLQNTPILSEGSVSEAGGLTVKGSLSSAANERYRVEFFVNGPEDKCQGRRYVGSIFVTTNSAGETAFDVVLDAPSGDMVLVGELLSSTASAVGTETSSGSLDTSEFSGCVSIIETPDPLPLVRLSPLNRIVSEDEGLAMFTVSLDIPAPEEIEILYSTADGSATAGLDYVGVTDESVTISAGQTEGAFSIVLIDDEIVEGDETFSIQLTLSDEALAELDPTQNKADVSIEEDDVATATPQPTSTVAVTPIPTGTAAPPATPQPGSTPVPTSTAQPPTGSGDLFVYLPMVFR